MAIVEFSSAKIFNGVKTNSSWDKVTYVPIYPVISGGSETTIGNIKRHTFTTVGSNNLVISTIGNFPITFHLWGGAGGGGYNGSAGSGAGGYTTGDLNISTTGTYFVLVGEGGNSISAGGGSGAVVQGGGGRLASGWGGQGGGYSGIFTTSGIAQGNAIAIAGGGGGASWEGATGGPGGGSSGVGGGNGTNPGGRPGNLSGGGLGSNSGSALQGGNQAGGDGGGGGAGGGGYFGGGGGYNTSTGSGGGGGSGYTHPSLVKNGITYAGSGTTPPGTGVSGYISPRGYGVGGASKGNNGMVIIQYQYTL